MKKIIKILSFILVFVFLFSACECGSEDPKETGDEREYTNIALLKDGKTDYKIVVPAELSAKEELASYELKDLFKLSAKIDLQIVKDDEIEYAKGDHYLFIGLTRFLDQFGILPKESELGTQGYIIKNIDESMVMTGATKSGYGTVYSVYEFLEYQIGFETYASDEVYVEEYENVNLVKLDLQETPDIPNFWAPGGAYKTDSNFLHRSRAILQSELFTNSMSPYHTSFVFLNPDKYKSEHPLWYTKDIDNVCWTAHGDADEYSLMVQTLFETFREYVDTYPDIVHIGFSMQDVVSWCTCEECQRYRNEYGANSATCIHLLNDLSDKFDEYFAEKGITRELDFMFLAYKETAAPPVKKNADGTFTPLMKCKDNVYPFYCMFYMDRASTIRSSKNNPTYEAIEGWSAVSKTIAYWYYSANFASYIIPLDPFNCLQDNFKYMSTKSPAFFCDEGAGYSSCFGLFKDWLTCKIAWDTDEDVEKLTDKYFKHYFKDAEVPMRKLYDSIRLTMVKNLDEFGENHYDHVAIRKELYSQGLLLGWIDLINQAMSNIEYLKNKDPELYQKLYVRILRESLTPRYVLITLYGEYYSTAELDNMKSQFKADCGTSLVTEVYEGSTVDDLWM